MYNDILAKSDPKETLIEHTKKVIDIWEKLYSNYKEIINDNNFWENSFISIVFHDLGKVSENFQNSIKNNNFKNSIRHELISGIILLYFKNNIEPLCLFSLFSHHKLLNDFIFDDQNIKTLFFNKDKLKYIIDLFLTIILKKEININDKYNLNDIINLNINDYYNVFKKYFDDEKIKIKKNNRKEYIFYKSILNISDWLASGNKDLFKGIDYDKNFLKNKIIDKLIKEKKIKTASEFKFKAFQEKSLINKDIIAIAPTGSGKTEASLLWTSLKNINNRIFYLMPTKVTANSIYKRLIDYFGKDNISIIHSSAYLMLKESDDNYSKLTYLLDKTFFNNINIGTIDQVLTQGFNLGYWELKTFHMLNAKIIIDEIHMYQSYTLGLIISTIKYLKNEFNCSFFIMSATLPLKLKTLLEKSLNNNFDFIEDSELLNSSRNTFEIKEKYIDELKDEIIKNIKLNKKILIVVNTVNEAIKLYEEYNKITNKIICYHSRFMQKDRIEKEKVIIDIEENRINNILFIATQVVEVSLDIDYDILFTENAPIDSLIQRAGRVNRNRNKKNTKVIIFKHSELSEKYVYKDIPNILNDTFEILKNNNNKSLTENELIDMVNEVYNLYDIEQNEGFIKGLNVYNEIQKQNNYIQDLTGNNEIYTREGIDSIGVIPEKFNEELLNKSIEEKSKYEVSIRIGYLNKLKPIKDTDGFIFVDCDYDYDRGLMFRNYDDNSTIFI